MSFVRILKRIFGFKYIIKYNPFESSIYQYTVSYKYFYFIGKNIKDFTSEHEATLYILDRVNINKPYTRSFYEKDIEALGSLKEII